VGLMNCTGREFACGYLPRLVDGLYPVRCICVSHILFIFLCMCVYMCLFDSSVVTNDHILCNTYIHIYGTGCCERTRTTLPCLFEIPPPVCAVSPVPMSRVCWSRFDGYSNDSTANASKLLHDVFKRGDVYFNSGDLLSRDASGYFFWCDRIGDTYR
jgi:hypothetical protein